MPEHLTDDQIKFGMVVRYTNEYNGGLFWITSLTYCDGCKFNHYHGKRVGDIYSDAEYFATCVNFYKANTVMK
jgi:hypothetical protein